MPFMKLSSAKRNMNLQVINSRSFCIKFNRKQNIKRRRQYQCNYPNFKFHFVYIEWDIASR